ncbi:hypothetical protein M427DRAFT_68852 [Gonapodya prolifera JEL478]|uniref:Calcineurin-like phosphoesterase domain-containing protein n=1 Tax=Gonapodya prolifera (strain JEL478) TaxID=1344416 RepID=A0A139AJA8_GONPJ|nr:hypothetical protein M427DRAFT_68852 [Gonapodya prolifera JEL478]|eukprot:KXS16829.1 hypothetical protein M427DRAFT_68852 [Gonapodya prolifera JEL478]
MHRRQQRESPPEFALTFLLCSDLHGNLGHLDTLIQLASTHQVDFLVLAGDLHPRMSLLSHLYRMLGNEDSTWEVSGQRHWAETELWPRLAQCVCPVIVGWGNADFAANDDYHVELLKTPPYRGQIYLLGHGSVRDVPIRRKRRREHTAASDSPGETDAPAENPEYLRIFGMPMVSPSHHYCKDRERVDFIKDLECALCFPDLAEPPTPNETHAQHPDDTPPSSNPPLPHLCRYFDVASDRSFLSDARTKTLIMGGGIPLNPEDTLEAYCEAGLKRLRDLRVQDLASIGPSANGGSPQPSIPHLATPSPSPDHSPTDPSQTAAPAPHTPPPSATLALLHSPPYATCLDAILPNGDHVGSQAVRSFLEQARRDALLDVAVCGHIHETVRVSQGNFAAVVRETVAAGDGRGPVPVWEAAGEGGSAKIGRIDAASAGEGQVVESGDPLVCFGSGNDYKREKGYGVLVTLQRFRGGERKVLAKRIPVKGGKR